MKYKQFDSFQTKYYTGITFIHLPFRALYVPGLAGVYCQAGYTAEFIRSQRNPLHEFIKELM